jgi:hypothetical protein
MRFVELPAQPDEQNTNAAQLSGPVADPGEHRFASRLRDNLNARHARLADASVVSSAREQGGQEAKIFLDSLLGDDWMLICGYQNSAGRIDQLLVGAHGVVAMTSLYLDAVVHCHGDKWRAEQFDHRTGKRIGEIHLHDDVGRSPSAQLNQAADTLEQFLRSSGVEINALRVVLLDHPRSRMPERLQQTVNIFTSSYDLGRWLDDLPKVLDRAGRRELDRLLTGHN